MRTLRDVRRIGRAFFATVIEAVKVAIAVIENYFLQPTQPSSIATCGKGSSNSPGLALAMRRDVQSSPNGNRPQHRRRACASGYRDKRFTCGPQRPVARFWSAALIDLHCAGDAHFCAGLFHRGFRACPELVIQSGRVACISFGDCNRCPCLMGDQAVICLRVLFQSSTPCTPRSGAARKIFARDR